MLTATGMIDNKESTKILPLRILYIQYTNPAGYPPLEHSSRILAQEGWEVLFLGTGASGAGALKFPPHQNINVYQIPFCNPGMRQKLHYIKFCIWVLIWVARWQPKWVYASDILSCPIAFILSFFPLTKLVYHEHDSPTSITESLFVSWCLQARKNLAHRAKLIILPNQQRADKFTLQTGVNDQIIPVWNCPSTQEVFYPTILNQKDELWLWYHGSIVPTQLPLTIINALATLPEKVKLKIAGYETIGHRGYVQELEALANTIGIEDRIHYIGTLPKRSELLDCCSKCDIGLSLFTKPTREPMAGASNKPFDYLACGLPLLVSNLPDWIQMYVEAGYGLACNPEDPASIAAVLRWYLEHPVEMRKMGEKGRQRILDEWNYETQFHHVFKELSRVN